MEAKDTVMSDEQMKTIILSHWCSPETRLSDVFPEPWDYAMVLAQAEISFPAGKHDGEEKVITAVAEYCRREIDHYVAMIKQLDALNTRNNTPAKIVKLAEEAHISAVERVLAKLQRLEGNM